MTQVIKKPLVVPNMTLSGVHLIEASAGTGKTFNITRIVMRLLLETEHTMEKILVVTFTKAATQELKNRIATTLLAFKSELEKEYQAWLEHPQDGPIWTFKYLKEDVLTAYMQDCKTPDDVSRYLLKAIDKLTKSALVLDEAPIYTINAFCQKELIRNSFLSGLPFEFDIENSLIDLVLESIQDEYRRILMNEETLELLTAENIATPEQFYNIYGRAIFSELPIYPVTQKQLEDELKTGLDNLVNMPEAQQIIAILNQYYPQYEIIIENALKAKKVPKYAHTTMAALDAILAWFDNPDINVDLPALSSVLSGSTQLPKLTDDDAERTRLKAAVKDYETFTNKLKKLRIRYAGKDLAQLAQRYQLIYELVVSVKKQLADKKTAKNVLDHTDTVRLFATAIKYGPTALLDDLRTAYPVALIDEFQDTDQHQYTIFSHIYPKQTTDMLLMIGDPKQAIYGFRGGDIFTYLNAAQNIDYAWSMQKNYRSTAQMITAYDLLFYGIDLSSLSTSEVMKRLPLEDQDPEQSPSVATASVSSTDSTEALVRSEIFGQSITAPWIYPGKPSLVGLVEKAPPIQFFYPDETYEEGFKPGQKVYKGCAAVWVTNEIIRLLESVKLHVEKDDVEKEHIEAVKPKDIAILVRGKSEAKQVGQTLARAGLKSVYLSNKQSVFASQEAQQVLALLDGLQHYRNTKKVLQACATELWGLSLNEVAELQDIMSSAYDNNVESLVGYAEQWQASGIYSLITKVLKERFVSRKGMLERERQITNYLHLGDILQEQSKSLAQRSALVSWLARQIDHQEAELSTNNDDIYIQRLDSDDELIKIVTIHGSKGLEYPIVFVPYAGYEPYKKEQKALQYQTSIAGKAQQIIQIGLTEEAERVTHAQDFAELTRLLYVAVTRAAYRCYIGLGKPNDFASSTVYSALGINAQSGQDILGSMGKITQLHPDSFAFHPYSIELALANINIPQQTTTYASAVFSGNTDMQWEVQSFSKITRQHTFTDLQQKDREQDEKPSIQAPVQSTLIRFTLPKGANAGNLLHNILEDHDFNEAFNLADHEAHLATFRNTHTEHVNEADLTAWFEDILATPIQVLDSTKEKVLDTFSLRDLRYTLKEPEFYFPLASVSVDDLAQLLGEHRQRDLKTKSTYPLNGMLHGFIDLLFEYQGKYYVADYKSNYLGDSLDHYNSEAMTRAIEGHDYDLQYLIYSWALHQMLSQKLPNYSFSEHFGGVYYFFLRGMSCSGPDMSGVYQKHITSKEMTYLSEIFGGKAEEDVA